MRYNKTLITKPFLSSGNERLIIFYILHTGRIMKIKVNMNQNGNVYICQNKTDSLPPNDTEVKNQTFLQNMHSVPQS